ncbi:MAG: carboxypeptidase-like regulatory domain-containing protein [Cytophagales bacterium]
MKKILTIGFSLFAILLFAQGSKNVIQFSGLVVGGDSLYGIPGVFIAIPKAGRGTISNDAGFFSIPTLVGDSLEISAIGYKKRKLGVPKSDRQSVTLIIEMQEDTTFYPIVEIFPYPTEDLFKKAFLALQLPDRGMYTNMYANTDQMLLQRLIINSAMGSSENHKYSLRNQVLYPGAPIGSGGLQIFNPFAWSSLVKSIRKGDANKRPEE